MAQLYELLKESELLEIRLVKYSGGCIDVYQEIKDITIEDLSRLSFMLIKTEYNSIVPNCVLAAESINILTKRAVELNIPMFNA